MLHFKFICWFQLQVYLSMCDLFVTTGIKGLNKSIWKKVSVGFLKKWVDKPIKLENYFVDQPYWGKVVGRKLELLQWCHETLFEKRCKADSNLCQFEGPFIDYVDKKVTYSKWLALAGVKDMVLE